VAEAVPTEDAVNDAPRSLIDEVVKQALDSTEGFILVLAGAKAFLERNITLNLISDRYPDGH